MCPRMIFVCLLLLSSKVYPQHFISWSPDGTQLAFNNVDGIYIMNRDGSDLRKLAADVSERPSWLPDGRVIFRGERGIYSINPDGSQWVLAFEGAISVSPDGKRQLFIRSSGENTAVLEVDNADGSGRVELYTFYDTDRLLSHYPYVWSPDSEKIAFRIAHGQGTHSPIFLTVLLPTSHSLGIVTGNSSGDYFSWAPNSKRIAFDTREGDEGRSSVYVVDIDTKEERLLIENAYSPVWSPNGKYIAFSRRDNTLVWDIYVLDMESNTQIRLTADPGPEYGLTWSPDSASLAYMSDFIRGNIGLRAHVIDVKGEHHVTAVEGLSWGEIKSQFHK